MDPTPRRRAPGSIHAVFTRIPAPGAPVPEPPVLPEVWWKDQSPNLWWPADRAWIVASEIDHTWTYIGGTAALIRSILDHTDLEALPVELTDWP